MKCKFVLKTPSATWPADSPGDPPLDQQLDAFSTSWRDVPDDEMPALLADIEALMDKYDPK